MDGVADGWEATDGLDETTPVEGSEDTGAVDTADGFDLGAGNGLLIGDDREGFDGCWGEAGFAIEAKESANVGSETGGTGELDGAPVALEDPSGLGALPYGSEGSLDVADLDAGSPG